MQGQRQGPVLQLPAVNLVGRQRDHNFDECALTPDRYDDLDRVRGRDTGRGLYREPPERRVSRLRPDAGITAPTSRGPRAACTTSRVSTICSTQKRRRDGCWAPAASASRSESNTSMSLWRVRSTTRAHRPASVFSSRRRRFTKRASSLANTASVTIPLSRLTTVGIHTRTARRDVYRN